MKVFIIYLIVSITFSFNLAYATNDGTVNCSISCTGLRFSNTNPYDSTQETTIGTISVRCTTSSRNNTTFTYYVGVQGSNSSNYNARYLLNGSNKYSYNICLVDICNKAVCLVSWL